ncbi:MAG TPA: tyrosine recombinase [Gemmataceae bacterium]
MANCKALERDLQNFLAYLTAERRASRNTIAAYGHDLKKYRDFVAGGGVANHLAPKVRELTRYLEQLYNQRLCTFSVSRNLSAVRSFYRFLRLEERTTDNTASLIEGPKLWQRLPKPLSVADCIKLVEAPENQRYADRDKAILEFLYATGARAFEVCNLRTEHLNLVEGWCQIQGKGMRERIVPVGSYAIEAIQYYYKHERLRLLRQNPRAPWVFLSKSGKRLNREMIFNVVKRYGQMIGKDIHPHHLRHSFATHLLRGGCGIRVVQELCGHGNIVTTQLYTQLDMSDLKATHAKYHPRGGASAEEKDPTPLRRPARSVRRE